MDVAGGIPDVVKDYINSMKENDSLVRTRIGLGMILIKGLAPLCGVKVSVTDNLWDSRAVGTIYLLEYDRKKR